jgi:hypothetical protein
VRSIAHASSITCVSEVVLTVSREETNADKIEALLEEEWSK